MGVSSSITPESSSSPAALDELIRSPSRLTAVQRLQILDSAPEEAFDALTRLATMLLKATASFVSVVDADRDFYKSQFGFPDMLACERQLSGRTFCHHTLARHEPLIINDTHADPLWAAVPSVSTLGVRAYVGFPLRIDSETIGSFCVIDNRPRAWTEFELDIVAQLALSAGRELNLRGKLQTATAQAIHAQTLVRANEETMAIVAHDLRTPLHVLKLSATLLQGSVDPAQQGLTGRMLAAIDSMKRMVDDLLAANAVVVPSEVRREEVSVAKLLGDAVDTMGMIAARVDIKLEIGTLPDARLLIDYAQMLRVFCNLVGNSIKYCAPGNRVSLLGFRRGDNVHLTVSDNGPGMSTEAQHRAFERGWRGANGNDAEEGAGLGLSIVRTLVEQNLGHVALISELGKGTAVTVRLPCLEG